MKTIYSEDLSPIVNELKGKAQSLVDEYQIKTGLTKNEIRLVLMTNNENEKVEIQLAINPYEVNFVPHSSS